MLTFRILKLFWILVLFSTSYVLAYSFPTANPTQITNHSHFSSALTDSHKNTSTSSSSSLLMPRPSTLSPSSLIHQSYYSHLLPFHANNSLIGKLIPCTYDEKICLKSSLILSPEKDKCISLFGLRICKLDRTEFEHRSGRLASICTEYSSFEDYIQELPCSGYRMAYDGNCYSEDFVRDVICGCNAEPVLHIFGGYECHCSPLVPRLVKQPEEDRLCRIPDFRFRENNIHIPDYFSWPTYLNCSLNQSKCFLKNEVWLEEHNNCFPLLQRGPCEEDYVIALNKTAAEESYAEGICVHERDGCPKGHKRVTSECKIERDIVILDMYSAVQNIFGEYDLQYINFERYIRLYGNGSVCAYDYSTLAAEVATSEIVKPICPETDSKKSLCSSYESNLPKPTDY